MENLKNNIHDLEKNITINNKNDILILIDKIPIINNHKELKYHLLKIKNYFIEINKSLKQNNNSKEISKILKIIYKNIDLIKEKKFKEFDGKILLDNLTKDTINVSFDKNNMSLGKTHPLIDGIYELEKIMDYLGFKQFNAPIIDTEDYNFTYLNIEKNHPSRTMHDTFFLKSGHILRTHTSNIQPRIMELKSMNNEDIKKNNQLYTSDNSNILDLKNHNKYYHMGKVFRVDSDATHLPMFNQIEIVILDNNINLPLLKALALQVFSLFFNKKIELRFRPSYFPFTEPSYEIDMKLDDKFLEIGGLGIIHKNVLTKNSQLNNKIDKGVAFGFGIERLVMIKNNIKDIRVFYDNSIHNINLIGGKIN